MNRIPSRLTSVRFATLKLTFIKEILPNLALFKLAPLKSAPSISAFRRSAFDKFAPERFAERRLVSNRVAFSKIVDCRLALSKMAPLKSALLRFKFPKFASDKSQFTQLLDFLILSKSSLFAPKDWVTNSAVTKKMDKSFFILNLQKSFLGN